MVINLTNILDQHSIYSLPFFSRGTSSFWNLFILFLPEFCIFGGIFFYFCTYFFKTTRHIKVNFFIYFCILFLTLFFLFFKPAIYNYEFTLVNFHFNWYSKVFLILFMLVFSFLHFYQVHFAWYSNNKIDLDLGTKYFEVNLILLVALFSSFILLSCNDFILFLVSLEVFSLCLYILTSLSFERISIEATLKYFFSNIFFSLLIILGIVVIYWAFYEINFSLINFYFQNYKNILSFINDESFCLFHKSELINNYFTQLYYRQVKWLAFGLFFIILGILCKLGLFPGYFWVLDVYGNISVLSNIFLSIFPKFVYIVLLIKLHLSFSIVFYESFINVIYLLSALISIIYGLLVTLNQWRIKKFMAGSSIVNLSFLILILFFSNFSVFSDGSKSVSHSFDFQHRVLFCYLFIYLINVLFFFFVYLVCIQPQNIKLNYYFEDLREFVILKYNHKFILFFLALIFLSFAGVPPLMGFFPKLLLFKFLLIKQAYSLIFVIIVSSVISAFYYIRVIRFILFSNINVYGLLKIRYSLIFKILLGFFFIFLFFFMFIFHLFIIHLVI